MPVIKEKGTPYSPRNSRIQTETVQLSPRKRKFSRDEIERIMLGEESQDVPSQGRVILSQFPVVRTETKIMRTRIMRKEVPIVSKPILPISPPVFVPPWTLKLPTERTDYPRVRKYLSRIFEVTDYWCYLLCWVVPFLLLVESTVLDRFPLRTWHLPSFASAGLTKHELPSKKKKMGKVKKPNKKHPKIQSLAKQELYMPPYRSDQAVISFEKGE